MSSNEKFLEILTVRTADIDGGGSDGPEYFVHYTLYETLDERGFTIFELYRGDDKGNGSCIAVFKKRYDATEVVRKLGVEVAA